MQGQMHIKLKLWLGLAWISIPALQIKHWLQAKNSNAVSDWGISLQLTKLQIIVSTAHDQNIEINLH